MKLHIRCVMFVLSYGQSYRPLTILSFRLEHYMHELEVSDCITVIRPVQAYYYHLTNNLLHGVVSCFVSFLSYFIFGEGTLVCLFVEFSHNKLDGHLAALYSGLLFAAHPVHVEAVTGKGSLLSPLTKQG